MTQPDDTTQENQASREPVSTLNTAILRNAILDLVARRWRASGWRRAGEADTVDSFSLRERRTMANPPPASTLPASGPATPGKLPARIRDAIRVQQESSEILIGWIQLAIVLTFTVLYLLSPKPHGDTVMATAEPWILGAYIAFTAVRLGLAYRRLLPAWLLHLSVVIDMALLLALIWSFHLKYGQPASFYLKVPTLLYVFIFISLRACASRRATC